MVVPFHVDENRYAQRSLDLQIYIGRNLGKVLMCILHNSSSCAHVCVFGLLVILYPRALQKPSPLRFRYVGVHAAEAAPLIERLSLVEDKTKFPSTTSCRCYSGMYREVNISVVTNGKCKRFGVDQIGTVSAGLTTWLSIEVRSHTSLFSQPFPRQRFLRSTMGGDILHWCLFYRRVFVHFCFFCVFGGNVFLHLFACYPGHFFFFHIVLSLGREPKNKNCWN